LAVCVALVLFVSLAFALKKCPQCGTTYPDDDNYCAECRGADGGPVKLAPVPKPQAQPRPQPRPEPEPQTASAPAGMKTLGRNAQGYEEALWLKDSSVMVKVPAGEFWMGSVPGEGDDDERPQHKVFLDEYWLDKHEVTNRQFERFVKATGHRTDAEKEGRGFVYDTDSSKWVNKPGMSWRSYHNHATESHPVVLVLWNDAKAYCDWAGKRLPTEAEWEKAARGTDARKYPWGNETPDAGGFYRANWGEGTDRSVWKRDEYEFTAPVGTYPAGASPYGLLDMAGNVWEWCADWYDKDYYGRSASYNPQGPSTGSFRVLRGGSWGNGAWNLRAAFRLRREPSNRNDGGGFRSAH
jgi:serine/threonine-protein kinase